MAETIEVSLYGLVIFLVVLAVGCFAWGLWAGNRLGRPNHYNDGFLDGTRNGIAIMHQQDHQP